MSTKHLIIIPLSLAAIVFSINSITFETEKNSFFQTAVAPSFINTGQLADAGSAFDSGIVAHYSFDDSTANDSVGGVNATLSGGSFTDGAIGKGLSLSGSDYGDLGAPSSFNISGDMTISGWIKAGSLPVRSPIISYSTHARNNIAWSLGLYGNRPEFVQGDGLAFDVKGVGPISTGSWYHIAAVRTGSSGNWTINLYVNGTLNTTATGAADSSIGSDFDARLGSLVSTGGANTTGMIDDVRLYNRALSASEIQGLYALGSSNVAASASNPPPASNPPASPSGNSGTTPPPPAPSSDSSSVIPADSSAPAITSILPANITSSSVEINWTTDKLASSEVVYGPTSAYGSSAVPTTITNFYTTFHGEFISGLNPSTTYHYKVKSQTEAGASTESGDKTFTTTAAIVVDSSQAHTYYVDYAGGSDAADGLSQATAWKHSPGDLQATGIPHAVSIKPGSIVIFKGGVEYNGEVDVLWSGQPNYPITYRGNTPGGDWGSGRATINLNYNLYHGFYAIRQGYITVDSINIINAKNNTSSAIVPAGSCPAGQQKISRDGAEQCVTYSGANNVYDLGYIMVRGGNNWIIKNISIHGTQDYDDMCVHSPESDNDPSSDSSVPADQVGINFHGIDFSVKDSLIDNVEIYDVGRDAIRLTNNQNITVQNSNIGGAGHGSNDGYFAVAFRITAYHAPGYNITLYNNIIHDGVQYEGDDAQIRCHAGDWIHMYGNNNGVMEASQDPHDIMFDSNYIYNTKSFNYANGTANSFFEDDVYNVTWKNNVIINPHHIAVEADSINNFQFFNNTIITYPPALGGGASGLYFTPSKFPNSNIKIKNNILVTNSPNSAVMPLHMDALSSNLSSDYNIFFNPHGTDTARVASKNYTLAAWRTLSGQDAHSVFADPSFTGQVFSNPNASIGGFILSASTPLTNVGSTLGSYLPPPSSASYDSSSVSNSTYVPPQNSNQNTQNNPPVNNQPNNPNLPPAPQNPLIPPSNPNLPIKDLSPLNPSPQNPLVNNIQNIPSQIPAYSSASFTKPLRLGNADPQVKTLQQFLNSRGFYVALVGPGSPGKETSSFDSATQKALIRFQNFYQLDVAIPQSISRGTGYFGTATMGKINQIKGN